MNYLKDLLTKMNAQLPLPTFDDWRKLLQFWLEQQDKWFYFEGEKLQSGSAARITHSPPNLARTSSPWDNTEEAVYYVQTRIVGKIRDVVPYPPSLLLKDASVYTVLLSFDYIGAHVKRLEKRPVYGLVFSQITYYEPIQDVEEFLAVDERIRFGHRTENNS